MSMRSILKYLTLLFLIIAILQHIPIVAIAKDPKPYAEAFWAAVQGAGRAFVPPTDPRLYRHWVVAWTSRGLIAASAVIILVLGYQAGLFSYIAIALEELGLRPVVDVTEGIWNATVRACCCLCSSRRPDGTWKDMPPLEHGEEEDGEEEEAEVEGAEAEEEGQSKDLANNIVQPEDGLVQDEGVEKEGLVASTNAATATLPPSNSSASSAAGKDQRYSRSHSPAHDTTALGEGLEAEPTAVAVNGHRAAAPSTAAASTGAARQRQQPLAASPAIRFIQKMDMKLTPYPSSWLVFDAATVSLRK